MTRQIIGSNFDDFLAQEGMLEETTAVGMKRMIARQIEQEARPIGQAAFGGRLRTEAEILGDPGKSTAR